MLALLAGLALLPSQDTERPYLEAARVLFALDDEGGDPPAEDE